MRPRRQAHSKTLARLAEKLTNGVFHVEFWQTWGVEAGTEHARQ